MLAYCQYTVQGVNAKQVKTAIYNHQLKGTISLLAPEQLRFMQQELVQVKQNEATIQRMFVKIKLQVQKCHDCLEAQY